MASISSQQVKQAGGGVHAPIFPQWATVMAPLSEGFWEMGRVISHEAVTYADGRTGWRYTVAFISSRVFTFDEDELGRPEDVVDRRLSGH